MRTYHLDGFQKSIKAILGMLPRQQQQPLVANRLQGLHFLTARRQRDKSPREGREKRMASEKENEKAASMRAIER